MKFLGKVGSSEFCTRERKHPSPSEQQNSVQIISKPNFKTFIIESRTMYVCTSPLPMALYRSHQPVYFLFTSVLYIHFRYLEFRYFFSVAL